MKVVLASACLLVVAEAHMGITLNSEFPREKATVGDNYRSPDLRVSCHGTSSGSNFLELTAGATASGAMTYGAAHGGGHCSWMVAERSAPRKWYKINDKLDCTTAGTHDLVVPSNLPASCATEGCVLGWFWTPRFSGGCEIYHNCFDIKVDSATGGIGGTITYDAEPACARISDNTGRTTNFGPWAGEGGNDTPTEPTDITDVDVDAGTGCASHTVVSGDTLTTIAAQYDIPDNDYQLVADVNDEKYPSLKDNVDFIEIGWVLDIPQTGAAVASRSCDASNSNNPSPDNTDNGGSTIGNGLTGMSALVLLATAFAL